MADTNIRSPMPDHREVDQRVARIVMGLETREKKVPPGPNSQYTEPIRAWDFFDTSEAHDTSHERVHGRWRPVRGYSVDLTCTWQVIERMHDLGWHARITTPFSPGSVDKDGQQYGHLYGCGFTPHGITGWNGRPDYEACEPTIGEAVCEAALLVFASCPGGRWPVDEDLDEGEELHAEAFTGGPITYQQEAAYLGHRPLPEG